VRADGPVLGEFEEPLARGTLAQPGREITVELLARLPSMLAPATVPVSENVRGADGVGVVANCWSPPHPPIMNRAAQMPFLKLREDPGRPSCQSGIVSRTGVQSKLQRVGRANSI
jgi:hypothetical protein